MIRRRLIQLTLLFLNAVVSAPSAAEPIPGIPDFGYEVPYMSMENVVLGRTCMSLPSSLNGLSCNPAWMADEEKEQLRFNIAADEHFREVVDYAQLVQHKDEVGVVTKLLEQDGPSVSRLSGAAWYQHQWWAVSLVPARVLYASQTRNPAYPEINVHVMREMELTLKGGLFVTGIEGLQVGVQARLLEQKFIREEVALLDAFADPTLLRLQSSRAVMLEPAAVYTVGDDSWQPSISAMLTNLELIRAGSSDTRTQAAPDVGFSMKPAFAGGQLTTATHYTFRPQEYDTWKRLRWGAIWDARWAAFTLGLAKGEYGFGVTSAVDSVTYGLAFKSEEIGRDVWSKKEVRSVMLEAGLRF